MTDRLRAEIIGYDSGWGCREYGCEDGPAALQGDQILASLDARGVAAKWRGPMGLKFLGDHAALNAKEKTLPLVAEGVRRLGNQVRHAVSNGSIPIVIGGDNASSVGTWSGVAAAREAHQELGLIWMDAHMDAHTPETSSQGKWGGWWHGQLISALMGHGRPELTRVVDARPKLAARHITLIGQHSYEPGEKEFLEKHRVRIAYLDEVRKRGFKAVFDEALARATTGTKAFGLCIDMDCFHPDDAPGVGCTEDDGLHAAEVLPVLQGLARRPGFAALEIVEFNPHNDKDYRTARLVGQIISSVFAA